MKKIFFCFFSILFLSAPQGALAASSQDVNLNLEVRAIPSKATLGQEIRLVIQLERPKGYSIEPISKDIKLPPFEIRSIEKLPVSPRGNRVIETMVVRMAVYDLGDLQIPPVTLAVWNVSGNRGEAKTPPIPVQIVEVAKKAGDKNDIRPIKGPASLSLLYLQSWVCGIAAFFLLVFLVFKITHRKKIFSDPDALLPPPQRALKELNRLNEEHYLAAGKVKEHYSGLSDILRRYLERQFKIQALELTTAEVLANLKEKNFEHAPREAAGEILKDCDLVKFAKLVPERSLAADLEKRLKQFVETTRPAEPEAAEKKK